MSTARVYLEWAGESVKGFEPVWDDEDGNRHKLVKGQKYPASEALAAYLTERYADQWKRVESKSSTTKAKE